MRDELVTMLGAQSDLEVAGEAATGPDALMLVDRADLDVLKRFP